MDWFDKTARKTYYSNYQKYITESQIGSAESEISTKSIIRNQIYETIYGKFLTIQVPKNWNNLEKM